MNTEKLKAAGNYALAGRNASEHNEPRYYGCHYGMKSDREASMAEFFAGYDGAEATKAQARRAGWAYSNGLWMRPARALEPSNELDNGVRYISVASAGDALEWDGESPPVAS